MRLLKCMFCQIGHSSFLLLFFLPSFSWYSCFPCASMTPRLGSVGALWEFRQQTHKSRRLDRHSAVARPLTPCCRPQLQSQHAIQPPLRYQEFRHPCLISLSPSVCQLHRQGAPSGHWQINDSWVASLPQGDTTYWTLWYVCNTAFTHAPALLQISWINRSTFRPFWQVPQKSNKVQNTATTHYLHFTR